MKNKYTKQELISKLEETNFDVYWIDGKKSTKPHIIISIPNSKHIFADNTIHLRKYNVEIRFNCKITEKSKCFAIEEFMLNNFNVNFSTEFDSDKNIYSSIYLVELMLYDL